MAVTRHTPVFPGLALLGCLAAAALVITVVVRPVYLSDHGLLQATDRAWYATVVTIAASALTSFVSSRIRRLWIRRLDNQFEHPHRREPLLETEMHKIQRKRSVTLGLASLVDSLRHWEITASFLGAGLVTTAVVAGLAPSPAEKTSGYALEVSSGRPYQCATVSDSYPGHAYTWRLKNGSTLAVDWLAFPCPPRLALGLMSGINSYSPDVFAYSDLGVAVYSTAIGTPVEVYGFPMGLVTPGTDRSLPRLLRVHGSDVLSTTQCVRTMVSNPVSCRVGGTTYRNGGSITAASSLDGACNISPTLPGLYMLGDICSSREIGTATIVIGAIDGYASRLALAMGVSAPQNGVLTVTCTVDARDVFRYRTVALSFRDAGAIAKTNLGRQLNGSTENCDVFHAEDNIALLALASIANKLSLSQYANSGFYDSIDQAVTNPRSLDKPRGPPFAFPNSRNALEDVLGLVTALVTSRLNSTPIEVPATAVIQVSRVGSGGNFALVYAIPPLFAAVVLIALMSPNRRKVPEVSTGELEDLIAIGRQRDPEPASSTSLLD